MKTLLFVLLTSLNFNLFAAQQGPRELLVEIHDQVIVILERDKERLSKEPEYLESQLKNLVDPHVDFKAMGRLMLGKHWKSASAEQRERFTAEFRSMLARIYGKSIALYDGQELEFLPFKAGKKASLAKVQSKVNKADGTGLPIDFRLRFKKSDGWKIFDIMVDGISLIKNYKSSFQREIAQVGLEGLLENITKRGKKKKAQQAEQ
jgi:phospholipid transport system substrate-binding protein